MGRNEKRVALWLRIVILTVLLVFLTLLLIFCTGSDTNASEAIVVTTAATEASESEVVKESEENVPNTEEAAVEVVETIQITESEIVETEQYTETEALEAETETTPEEAVEVEACTNVLPNENVPLDYDLQYQLEDLCNQYDVPIEIVLGCIQIESGFKDYAVNPTGDCYGYMQVNTCNMYWLGNEIGVTDLSDPYQNLHSGIYILAYFYERYPDWGKVLVCYNNGEEYAKLYFFNEGYYSTTYSRTVMGYAEDWAEVIYE